MKRCDYFKDLILTDFIDGQLDQGSQKAMEAHLMGCLSCQSFLKEVKTNTVSPFGQIPPQEVPVELWQKISEGIEVQLKPIGLWEKFVGGLVGWMVWPRLVPVLATVVLMVVGGAVSFKNLENHRTQDSEQGQYLASVITINSPSSASEGNDKATVLEQYFL